MSILENHWFGYPPIEGSRMAWGARAIFKPHTGYPLDLLPDRQGIKRTEEDIPMFKQEFCPFIDSTVFPVLKDLSKAFNSDSLERFTWHFEWPHDPAYLVVAEGSPNASYGYFYLAVSLVERDKAPAQVRPERYRTPEEREADRIRKDREWAEWESKREEERRISRAQSRAANKLIKAKVEAGLGNGPFKTKGQTLEVGDRLLTNANQADREAVVRAIAGNEALIEYFMPKGRSFFTIVEADTHKDVRGVSKSTIPKRFKFTA